MNDEDLKKTPVIPRKPDPEPKSSAWTGCLWFFGILFLLFVAYFLHCLLTFRIG